MTVIDNSDFFLNVVRREDVIPVLVLTGKTMHSV